MGISSISHQFSSEYSNLSKAIMKIFLLVALFIGIASSVHLPLKTTKKHDLIEGDMIIPPEIKEILRNKDSRNGVTDLWLRWPQATIYYQFDGVCKYYLKNNSYNH